MSGRLEVITGCMWSEKTTELLRRARRREKSACERVEYFLPAQDNRSERSLADHVPCKRLACGSDLLLDVRPDTQVVAIDEAHMLPDLEVPVIELVEGRGMLVIVAGLNLDAAGRVFLPMGHLAARAHSVSMLYANCDGCGAKGIATYTERLSKSKKRIDPGGAGKYRPLCPVCWRAQEAKVEECHRDCTTHGKQSAVDVAWAPRLGRASHV